MCAPLVSLVPLNGMRVDLNKPYIIRNGSELGDLQYLPTKYNIQNISRMQMHAHLVSSGPLNRVTVDLNKPYVIQNSRELGDLEYLPTKTQYTIYLQNMDARTSRLFGPFKRHCSSFK